jgi:hypothetical protein
MSEIIRFEKNINFGANITGFEGVSSSGRQIKFESLEDNQLLKAYAVDVNGKKINDPDTRSSDKIVIEDWYPRGVLVYDEKDSYLIKPGVSQDFVVGGIALKFEGTATRGFKYNGQDLDL